MSYEWGTAPSTMFVVKTNENLSTGFSYLFAFNSYIVCIFFICFSSGLIWVSFPFFLSSFLSSIDMGRLPQSYLLGDCQILRLELPIWDYGRGRAGIFSQSFHPSARLGRVNMTVMVWVCNGIGV